MMNQTEETPLVSIIMPVRNGRHFIDQAVESILNQTYQNFELLIVDDASTDLTWQILKSYRLRYPNQIKIYRLSKNRGAFGASNFLLKRAQGEFIALMDSDDVAYPERIEKQVNFLLDNKNVVVVGTQVNIINENGVIVGQKKLPTTAKKIYQDYAVVHPMVHPTCMINKNLLPKKKYFYRIEFGVSDDYYTLFGLLRYGDFVNLNEPLLNYRIHLKNSSLCKLKEKFYNSLKIRRLAVEKFGYKITLKNKLLIYLQLFLVLSIPERFIFNVYLICRGICTPYSYFGLFINKMKLFSLRPKEQLSLIPEDI